MATPITFDGMLSVGLVRAGIPEERQQRRKVETNLQSFRSTYKVGPEALVQLFDRLQNSEKCRQALHSKTTVNGARQPSFDLSKLLKAVSWMANYNNEKKMEGEFNLNEKTIRNDNWRYVEAIAALKDDVVNTCR